MLSTLGKATEEPIGLSQPNVATGAISKDLPYGYKTGSLTRFQALFTPDGIDVETAAKSDVRNLSEFYNLFNLVEVKTKAQAESFLFLFQSLESFRMYSYRGDPAYKTWVEGLIGKAKALATNDGGLRGLASEVINRLMELIRGQLPPVLQPFASTLMPKIKEKLMEKLKPYIEAGNAIINFTFALLCSAIKAVLPYSIVPGNMISRNDFDDLINQLCTIIIDIIRDKAQALVDELLPRSDPKTQAKYLFVGYAKSLISGSRGDFASMFNEPRTLSNVVFNNGQDLGDYIELVTDAQTPVKLPKPFAYTTTKQSDGRVVYTSWKGQSALLQAALAWAPNLASSGALANVLSTLESSASFISQQVPAFRAGVDQLKLIASSGDIGRVERMTPLCKDSSGTITGPLKFVDSKLVVVMSGPKSLRQTFMDMSSPDEKSYIDRVNAFKTLVIKTLEREDLRRKISDLERRTSRKPSNATASNKTIDIDPALLTKLNKEKADAEKKLTEVDAALATAKATYADLETFMNTDYAVLDQLVPYLICPTYTSLAQTGCGTTIDQSPTGLLGRFSAYLNAIKASSLALQAAKKRNKILLWIAGGLVVGGGGFYLWKRHQKKKQIR